MSNPYEKYLPQPPDELDQRVAQILEGIRYSRAVKKLERSVPGQFRNPPSASPGRLNPAVVSGYSVHFYG